MLREVRIVPTHRIVGRVVDENARRAICIRRPIRTAMILGSFAESEPTPAQYVESGVAVGFGEPSSKSLLQRTGTPSGIDVIDAYDALRTGYAFCRVLALRIVVPMIQIVFPGSECGIVVMDKVGVGNAYETVADRAVVDDSQNVRILNPIQK